MNTRLQNMEMDEAMSVPPKMSSEAQKIKNGHWPHDHRKRMLEHKT
jgi:hypothetical protein